jgi:formyl-CoA transferase
VVRGPSGTRLEGIAPSNIYRSANGTWVVIAANQGTVSVRLCQAMGRPELATDGRFATHGARGRNQDELDKIIGDWAGQRQPKDVIEALSAAVVIAGPINTVAEMVEDPQLRARGMIAEHYDERIQRSILGPGMVPVLSESPGSIRNAGPARPAQHTDDIYRGLLGRTAEELEQLRAERVHTRFHGTVLVVDVQHAQRPRRSRTQRRPGPRRRSARRGRLRLGDGAEVLAQEPDSASGQ